jgi:quercetin dioxygenase-like cupin family protein
VEKISFATLILTNPRLFLLTLTLCRQIEYRPLRFEIYLVEMEPNCTYESEAHSAGVEEYIMILQGSLEITIDGGVHNVKQSDSLRFIADQPHIYRNNMTIITRFYALIYYP